MNKTFRVSCTVDVHYEDSYIGAAGTLSDFIEQEGDAWQISNVQVMTVEELTEEEI